MKTSCSSRATTSSSLSENLSSPPKWSSQVSHLSHPLVAYLRAFSSKSRGRTCTQYQSLQPSLTVNCCIKSVCSANLCALHFWRQCSSMCAVYILRMCGIYLTQKVPANNIWKNWKFGASERQHRFQPKNANFSKPHNRQAPRFLC